jgi:hypothetical protein
MLDLEFRALTDRERALLTKLLEVEFNGCAELRSQLTTVTAKQVDEDGTLELHCVSGPPALTKYRPVADGRCKDSDGADIWLTLHVDDAGFMWRLEIIKSGESAVLRPPSAADLAVL